jgi:hypothetical protein
MLKNDLIQPPAGLRGADFDLDRYGTISICSVMVA